MVKEELFDCAAARSPECLEAVRKEGAVCVNCVRYEMMEKRTGDSKGMGKQAEAVVRPRPEMAQVVSVELLCEATQDEEAVVMLDDEVKVPGGSDGGFLKKMNKIHRHHQQM